MSNLQNIYFVLVRPNFLGNIGSVARVIKNFGFTNLRFVKAPKDYKDSEARRMAVDAIDVLKNAQLFDSLEDALADITVSLGTTSCQQRQLNPQPISDLSGQIKSLAAINKIAIVFGDERDGLTNAELARCHHIVTVPTNPDFAALNLAQAAGICAYEIAQAIASADVVPTLSTQGEDDILFAHLAKILHNAGFTRSYNHERVLGELRQFYQRAHPTVRETDLLRGALLKLAAMSQKYEDERID